MIIRLYREVLSTIHENYDYITPRPNVILQLHRDLYSYNPTSIGGRWKNTDNAIKEVDSEGNRSETAEAMEELCI